MKTTFNVVVVLLLLLIVAILIEPVDATCDPVLDIFIGTNTFGGLTSMGLCLIPKSLLAYWVTNPPTSCPTITNSPACQIKFCADNELTNVNLVYFVPNVGLTTNWNIVTYQVPSGTTFSPAPTPTPTPLPPTGTVDFSTLSGGQLQVTLNNVNGVTSGGATQLFVNGIFTDQDQYSALYLYPRINVFVANVTFGTKTEENNDGDTITGTAEDTTSMGWFSQGYMPQQLSVNVTGGYSLVENTNNYFSSSNGLNQTDFLNVDSIGPQGYTYSVFPINAPINSSVFVPFWIPLCTLCENATVQHSFPEFNGAGLSVSPATGTQFADALNPDEFSYDVNLAPYDVPAPLLQTSASPIVVFLPDTLLPGGVTTGILANFDGAPSSYQDDAIVLGYWAQSTTTDARMSFYGKFLVTLSLSAYGSTANKGWTRPNCFAIAFNSLGVAGAYAPYMCEMALPAMCQLDTGKSTVQPGMFCDAYGDSARSPGNAEPNQTCTQQFSGSDPYTTILVDAVLNSTVSSLVRIGDHRNYDYVREEYIERGVTLGEWGAWTLIPGAMDLAFAQVSNSPAFISGTNQPTNGSWVIFGLKSLYIDCGPVWSVKQDVFVRRIASASEYCNPDTEIPPPERVPLSELPAIYDPVPFANQYTDPRCGYLIQPGLWYTSSTRGWGTMQTAYFYTLAQQSATNGLTIQLNSVLEPNIGSTGYKVSVYNTFRRSTLEPRVFDDAVLQTIGDGGLAVAGSVLVTCKVGSSTTTSRPKCATLAQVTLWTSPISYYGTYPTTVLVPQSTFTVPILATTVFQSPFSFVVNISVSSGNPNITAPAQVVGFDVVLFDSTFSQNVYSVTFSNMIVTTRNQRRKCTTWSRTDVGPRYYPPVAFNVPVPMNLVPATPEIRWAYGVGLGECACDPLTKTGVSCASDVYQTPQGAFGWAGQGNVGQFISPSGQSCNGGLGYLYTDDADRGLCYYQADDGTNQFSVGTIDVGGVIQASTSAEFYLTTYPIVQWSENTGDEAEFQVPPSGITSSNTLADAQSAVFSIGAILPSWTSYSDVQQYLIAVNSARDNSTAIIVDMIQDTPEQGDANWMASEAGTTFVACATYADCGTAFVTANFSCGVDVPQTTCNVANIGNVAYHYPFNPSQQPAGSNWQAMFDGSLEFVEIARPVVPIPSGSFRVHAWYLPIGAAVAMSACTTESVLEVNLTATTPSIVCSIGTFSCINSALSGTTQNSTFLTPFNQQVRIAEIQVWAADVSSRPSIYTYYSVF